MTDIVNVNTEILSLIHPVGYGFGTVLVPNVRCLIHPNNRLGTAFPKETYDAVLFHESMGLGLTRHEPRWRIASDMGLEETILLIHKPLELFFRVAALTPGIARNGYCNYYGHNGQLQTQMKMGTGDLDDHSLVFHIYTRDFWPTKSPAERNWSPILMRLGLYNFDPSKPVPTPMLAQVLGTGATSAKPVVLLQEWPNIRHHRALRCGLLTAQELDALTTNSSH